MRLQGKVAIITGSSRGIGKGIAQKFASEGASVVVNARNLDEANLVVDEIKRQGGKAMALKADVRNRAEVRGLVKGTLDEFKAIHILVNNAGLIRRGLLTEMTEEDWNMVLGVNLTGTFNCIQAVLPHMMKQRYGKIVNIASIAGVGFTLAGSAAYGASKAGVIQLTRSTAVEAGPYGINANAIAPGTTVTELTYSQRSKEEVDKLLEVRKARAADGRIGTPEDVANLAVFLATDDSRHITGQVICCDGGLRERM